MAHTTVYFGSDPALFQQKEQLYLDVRRREGRVPDDATVRQLPHCPASSPYAREWTWRRRTWQRFRRYLLRTHADQPLRVLDLGCGNGWLAHQLTQEPQWEVWAVDLNVEELTQGARLFGRSNLHFVYADLLDPAATGLPDEGFDVVVLAASVQYFPDLAALVATLKKRLRPGGEIHLLDSPFYPNEAARQAARQRTLDYYTQVGVPEMATYYHHHLWSEVAALGGRNLNNSLTIKILQKMRWLAVFPWVRLTANG
jgi:ubiquinone/menaquinone biosynthesis C-methylase UbiE